MSEADNVPRSVGRPGNYEVWFLTLTDPASGHGYWIRSTWHGPRRGIPSAGIWFARFDPADPARTFGVHVSVSDWAVARDRFDLAVGKAGGGTGWSHMRSGHAAGEISEGAHRASWDLRFGTGNPTYRLLPPPLYRGGVAPSKALAPNVATAVSGSVTVDGERFDLRETPGQQGHVYGTRHAERWAWAHCSSFAGADAVLHGVVAQGRRGPVATPYLSFVGLRFDGSWIRFSGGTRARPFHLGMWRLDLQNRRYRLTGRVQASAGVLLAARYEDPDGGERHCHNSEIASCRLSLFERRAGALEEVALLESRGTTHAEWAGRTRARWVDREFEELAG